MKRPEFDRKNRIAAAAGPAQAGDMKLNRDQCWDAVERRDRSVDGNFFFGVVTTGVYCRPSCPSRRPLRENVRFYGTPEEAERDGLRPCLRCRPREAFSALGDATMLELCRFIESHLEDRMDLATPAAHAGLSRFHLQRRFRAVVGLTPRQYAEACRLRKLRDGLRQAGGVTEAVYDAGFGSSSRVYERADTRLGMTPGQYREGGRGVAITYAGAESPLGRVMIGATDRGICFLQFGDSDKELLKALGREYPVAVLEPMGEPARPAFRQWIDALSKHLAGETRRLDLPLDVRATAFQMKVWTYLQTIPYGEVRSYSEVAAGIGQPSAARAVASACARNRVALAIPCHRVIRGTGEPGGYRWGLARKRALLEKESGLN
jgi:AraC family transcriptional regulator, regulatory protein of adaptative response / methylated-DNA-[protein]-cysteine methyltransferase